MLETVQPLRLAPGLSSQLLALAREAYPREVCGVLLAPADAGEHAPIDSVCALPNRAREAGVCFEIAAADLARAGQGARRRGQAIQGFFHSHPDGDARPSLADLAGCPPWDGYAQLIVSLPIGRGPEIRAYGVAPHGWFDRPLIGD